MTRPRLDVADVQRRLARISTEDHHDEYEGVPQTIGLPHTASGVPTNPRRECGSGDRPFLRARRDWAVDVETLRLAVYRSFTTTGASWILWSLLSTWRPRSKTPWQGWSMWLRLVISSWTPRESEW
jgi:hypothetical protein